MLTAQEIQALKPGDVVTDNIFVGARVVTNVTFKGVSDYGKCYVGFYTHWTFGAEMSGSASEGEDHFILHKPDTAEYLEAHRRWDQDLGGYCHSCNRVNPRTTSFDIRMAHRIVCARIGVAVP